MDWTVRQASPAQAATIREIAKESWHAAYDDVLGAGRVESITDEWYALEPLEDSIADATSRDDIVFLLAVSEPVDEPAGATEIAGFGHAGVHAEDASAGLLTRLYARPTHWGDGVGTTLLDRIEDALASCSRLRVIVLADNEIGISFYESAGFDRVETRSSNLADGLEECVYEKPL